MPITSNAVATICGTRMYSALSFVPDICDSRVPLIAAFSLTAEPTNGDRHFILNQMVQNQERFKRFGPAVQYARQPASLGKNHRYTRHFATAVLRASRRARSCSAAHSTSSISSTRRCKILEQISTRILRRILNTKQSRDIGASRNSRRSSKGSCAHRWCD
jgi:hypothetical protein